MRLQVLPEGVIACSFRRVYGVWRLGVHAAAASVRRSGAKGYGLGRMFFGLIRLRIKRLALRLLVATGSQGVGLCLGAGP